MNMTEQMNLPSEDVTAEELATAKELRRQELEKAFGNFRFVVIRKELFAHLRDPAVVIRSKSITFNMACISGLEDVVFVQLLISENEKMFAVTGCNENDKDALRWCIAKPDKRKSRKMNCPDFTAKLYRLMGWDTKCRYKILGYKIDFEGQAYYVFDLVVKETFYERPKKGEPIDPSVDYKKGYYSEDIAGTFGVPVEVHKRQSQITIENGCINTGMATAGMQPAEEQLPFSDEQDMPVSPDVNPREDSMSEMSLDEAGMEVPDGSSMGEW